MDARRALLSFVDSMHLLFDNGADVSHVDKDGRTAPKHAGIAGDAEIASVLRKAGGKKR